MAYGSSRPRPGVISHSFWMAQWQLYRQFSGLVLGYRVGTKGIQLAHTADKLDTFGRGLLSFLEDTAVKGEPGETRILPRQDVMGRTMHVALVALSNIPNARAGQENESIRRAAAEGVKQLSKLSIKDISIDDLGDAQAAAEGATLASYNYSLKSQCEDSKRKISTRVSLFCPEGSKSSDRIAAAWQRGSTLGLAQNFARELSDTPANHMTPSIFCARIDNESQPYPSLKVIAHNIEYLRKQKMGAFLGVCQGTQEPPKLLEMIYQGRPSDPQTIDIALVGKGITFDSGGINIKPLTGMDGMKGDMSGAAAVSSAILAAARLNLPINIVSVSPLCENMPSGTAQKPGDVVTTMSGLTVEIGDTDAEGRLVLADALHYVQEKFKPTYLIDVASLTGAICVALGPHASGMFTLNDELAMRLEKAASTSGDWLWRMPLWSEYLLALESSIADIRNVSMDRVGGAINAAVFLQKVVHSSSRWAHIDMASVMDAKDYYGRGGMTGRPTRLLIELLAGLG